MIIWQPAHQDDNVIWHGRDIYDQGPEYTLWLNVEGPVRKAVLMKEPNDPEITMDEAADAAGHLGFKFFEWTLLEIGALIVECED